MFFHLEWIDKRPTICKILNKKPNKYNFLTEFRIKDLNKDAVKEVLTMQRILDSLGSSCKLLVASIRNTSEINELALNGVSSFTINNRIAEDLFKSKATIQAANQFQKDG